MPDEFIPVAEDSGCIIGIGRWALREACHQLKRWQEADPRALSLTMNVNLSPRQLRDPELIQLIDDVLAETGLDGHRINLEVTETAVLDRKEDTVQQRLRAIRARNLGLQMDDFGTGYSSLSCLLSLPFNVVKIDRSFVRSLDADPKYEAVIRSVVELAHGLGVAVTVEGVESDEQLARITILKCDAVQGFLFAPPLPAAKALDVLDAWKL
jgi:EAL domain-containing protein (putative c-di-GMP-specific phosphodiesterase class I)